VRIASERRALLDAGVPMWVVYTKGPRAPLGETAVRALLRERGLMDLKVASVSPALTALKFARTRDRAPGTRAEWNDDRPRFGY
jgi:hypothetical protein